MVGAILRREGEKQNIEIEDKVKEDEEEDEEDEEHQ